MGACLGGPRYIATNPPRGVGTDGTNPPLGGSMHILYSDTAELVGYIERSVWRRTVKPERLNVLPKAQGVKDSKQESQPTAGAELASKMKHVF